MHDQISRVKDYISSQNLLSTGDSVLISLSAGKDSVFLLELMLQLSAETGLRIGAFHLNHCTRGPESDADEEFIASVLRRKGVRAYIEKHDFGKGKHDGESFEEAARKVRYSRLNGIMREEGYSRIATAHNYDDNVETLLYRIFTGSGINGLAGIQGSRGHIIRPLLCLRKDEIYAYLKTKGILWREDSSNTDNNFARNIIRNLLIPEIIKFFPAMPEALARLSSNAHESLELLGALIKGRYTGFSEENGIFRLEYDSAIPGPVLKFLVSGIMRDKFSFIPSSAVLNEILKKAASSMLSLELYENNGIKIVKKILWGKCIIEISRDSVFSGCEDWEYPLALNSFPQSLRIPESGLSLDIKLSDNDSFCRYKSDPLRLFIQPGDEVKNLIIRNRRAGDRIRLEFGRKKLKKFFLEKKLDMQTRSKIPLITINSEVAAVMPGPFCGSVNRISEKYKPEENCGRILEISAKQEQ